MTQIPVSHPVLAGVVGVHAALDGIGDAQALYLSMTEKRQALRELCRAEARLAAVKLSVLAVAGDVAEETGVRDPGAWLAHDQRIDRRDTRADHRLAQALDTRWTRVAAGLASGGVHLDQARVITQILDDLTSTSTSTSAGGGGGVSGSSDGGVDPELLVRAEETLVVEAKRLCPVELRRLGRWLWEILDPDGAEERQARRLADAEAHAARKQRLTLRRLGDGTTRVSGLVPDAVAHRLGTYLEAFAQPRKQAAEADGRPVPYPRLLARAFGDLLERIDPARLPDHGGDATTVIVTIDYTSLVTDLAVAGLGFDPDTDDLYVSAAQARRLGCQAQVLPMVISRRSQHDLLNPSLGQASQILDVGRKDRLHPPAMRKTIRVRDKTCRAQGCGVKAPWCEIHHLTPWSHGGKTSVKDGILLCSHHHHLIHHPDYAHDRLPDGTVRYHRRR